MKPLRAFGVLGVIFVVGFVALGWSWHGAKHARYVPLQAPWVLSGGIAGISLIGLAIVSWHIFVARRDDEIERREWDRFVSDLIDVGETMRDRVKS